MKRILAFVLIPGLLQAGIQAGKHIPDALIITNSSKKTIMVDATPIAPGKKGTITLDHASGMNHVAIRAGSRIYRLTYPTYNPNLRVVESFDTVALDFTTLLCIAGDFKAITQTEGIDEITVHNDTLYTIAAAIALSKTRAQQKNNTSVNALMIAPHDCLAKMVRDQEVGKVIVTDENRVVHTLQFPCRNTARATNQEWAAVDISVQTLKNFRDGFSIKIGR